MRRGRWYTTYRGARTGVNPTESENARGGEGMKGEQTNARNILPRLPQGAGTNLKSYSPTQLHFLMRLSHLQRQRRDMVKVADGGDRRATSSMPCTISAKYGSTISPTRTPTMRERLVTRARASAEGEYWSAAAAASTRWRVACATG